MPEISRFYGIRILIYFDEHPHTAKKLVRKWYKLQKENIYKAWNHIQNEEIFEKIPPLE